MHKPILIAHRGDTSHYPENTIEAFQSAFSLGADGIECDVQMNKSGEIIVVHNYLYDDSKTYPLFSEILEKFSSKGRLEIEIKSFEPVCIEKVAALIKTYNPSNYEITSSVLPLLPVIRKSLPNSRIGMIFQSKLLESWMTPEFILKYLMGYMKLTNANVLHLDLDRYTSEISKAMHDNKFLLHSHLKTDNVLDYDKALKLNIDQCTFDNINLLLLVDSLG